MSYGRSPHYVYSDGKHMSFDFVRVPESAVNQFLYHVLLSHRREELTERLIDGRANFVNSGDGDWYMDREDSVIRRLMEK